MNPGSTNIAHNLWQIRATLPANATLVAVSKTQPVDAVLEAYREGQRDFGENRVRELIMKQPLLPGDIAWHFIGHLQTNKVRYIAPFVSLIHSIDSLKILRVVNGEAGRHDRVIDCLLQFHIATEETKFGMDLREARALLGAPEFSSMKNVRITGVMGMASFTDDPTTLHREFRSLRQIFDEIGEAYFKGSACFRIRSMGMSGDYPIAVEEGSNMVRIGTLIFGERLKLT